MPTWIKQLRKETWLFIINLGISQCHSLGVIRGKELPPHSGKLERSRRDYPNEYDGLLGVIPSKKKSDE